MIRAITLEEFLDSLGIEYGDLDDSRHVLDILTCYYSGKTTNSQVATYVDLEAMFKFGWELSELSRLVRIRTLTSEEMAEANLLNNPPTRGSRRGCI